MRDAAGVSPQQALLNQNRRLHQLVLPIVSYLTTDHSNPRVGCKHRSSSCSRLSTPSSISTFSSLVSHFCKIYPDQSHQKLACTVFAHRALTNLPAIRAENPKKNGRNPQRPPRFNQHPGNNSNRRSNNRRHLSPSSGGNTKILQSVRSAPLTAKIEKSRDL